MEMHRTNIDTSPSSLAHGIAVTWAFSTNAHGNASISLLGYPWNVVLTKPFTGLLRCMVTNTGVRD